MAMASMTSPDLLIDVQAMLDRAEIPASEQCCIYRVPYELRKLNNDAYTPKVVSIGPLHHSNPRLQNMKYHKLIYFKQFVERAEATLEALISSVEEIEPQVRLCYSETLNLSKNDFVKIILVDAGFIIELLRRYFGDYWTDNDIILLKPWLTMNIRLDLLLLENQLPFFVLEKLFNLAFATRLGDNNFPKFPELAFYYFGCYNRQNLSPVNVDIMHFTDLLRTFHLRQNHRPEREKKPEEHLPTATELLRAGVKIKVHSSECLLDLQFSKGKLKIPHFRVDGSTETLFRNMVALEQCQYPNESYITDYIAVLDFLINTGEDVDVLVRKGIVLNWLSDSNAVAELFNGLWKNVTHVDFNSDYLRVCDQLNAYYRSSWHNRQATLRRDYCPTAWKTAATCAAIALLLLSIVQTVFSILQVVAT